MSDTTRLPDIATLRRDRLWWDGAFLRGDDATQLWDSVRNDVSRGFLPRLNDARRCPTPANPEQTYLHRACVCSIRAAEAILKADRSRLSTMYGSGRETHRSKR